MIISVFKDNSLITFFQLGLLFLHNMNKTEYNIIGLMSGTSLDGIDLIFVTFYLDSDWKFDIHKAETIRYTNYWKQKLKGLVSNPLDELKIIDIEYTQYLSEVIHDFIKKHSIRNVDFISSHGHTALHQPKKGLTYQIGNLPNLSKLLNQIVVCDFRIQDVELGGQGAPLVPIGDMHLFSEYDMCLNLGGFANISYEINNERIAFDICPVNIVLNYYVNQLGFDYDDKGKIALSGTINNQLLEALNALEFYKLNHPKSLGLEWVKYEVFSLIDTFQIHANDVLRTFVEHIAIQLAITINTKANVKILITGGGVFNEFLIARIEAMIENELVLPSKEIIEFKEALIFAFLGVLKIRNEVNCLSSVTGASYDHSSGNIFHP